MMKAGGDFSPPLMGIKCVINHPSTRNPYIKPFKVRHKM